MRPSGIGSGIGLSNAATPTGGSAEKVIASGGVVRCKDDVRVVASVGHEVFVMVRTLVRSQAPESFDDWPERVDERVDVGIGRVPTDAGSQRMVGVDAHGLQHG